MSQPLHQKYRALDINGWHPNQGSIEEVFSFKHFICAVKVGASVAFVA